MCPDPEWRIPENNPEIVLFEDPRNNSALHGHFLVSMLIQLDEI